MSDFDGTAYQHVYPAHVFPPKPGGLGWALAWLP